MLPCFAVSLPGVGAWYVGWGGEGLGFGMLGGVERGGGAGRGGVGDVNEANPKRLVSKRCARSLCIFWILWIPRTIAYKIIFDV